MAGLCRIVWRSLHRVRSDRSCFPWPFCGQNKAVHRIYQNQHVPYISVLHRVCSGENNNQIIDIVCRTCVSYCFSMIGILKKIHANCLIAVVLKLVPRALQMVYISHNLGLKQQMWSWRGPGSPEDCSENHLSIPCI